jgi:branched-chain amino acid transport system substrate-binding protein
MVVHDLYIARVKNPAQVAEPHAWFEILSTIPAATAFPVGTECEMPQ